MYFNKKGNLFDAIPILITVFVLGFVFVVALNMFSAINESTDQLPNSTEFTKAKEIGTFTNDNIAWVLDFILLMMFITLPVGSMILAFFNNIPPFFFWASIGVILIVLIIGGILQDSWSESYKVDSFKLQADRMPMTTYILNNYIIYSLLVIIIIAGGVFVKTRSQIGY